MTMQRFGSLAAAAAVCLPAISWADDWSLAGIAKLSCDEVGPRLQVGLKAGSVEAARTTGILLDTGVCFPENPRSAAAFYQRAADAGDRIARERLAALFAAGRGVEQDYASAGALLREPPPGPGEPLVREDYGRGYAYLLSTVAAADITRRGGFSRAMTSVAAFRTLPFGFDPSDPARTVSIRASVVESRQTLLALQRALADALGVAMAKVPAPDASRLTPQRFEIVFVSTLDAASNDVVTASTPAR